MLTAVASLSMAVGAHADILQESYFGTGGGSAITAVATDPATGDLIVAGATGGVTIPGSAGGFQPQVLPSGLFVARIDRTLQRIVQTTALGGVAGQHGVDAIAVHPQTHEIYVAGVTTAPDYPGGGGGAEPVLGGSREDGYVTRLSANLRFLGQTTFTNVERGTVYARDLAINATTGDVYIAGEGFGYAVVTRFNRELTARLSRVVIDGDRAARAFSLAINQTTGEVYVAGGTLSQTFPQAAGGLQPTFDGNEETAVVMRFDASLGQHLQSTYLFDVNTHVSAFVRRTPLIAVHPATGDVYVAGITRSASLPANGAQPAFGGGGTDAAVTRLSADLKQRLSSTYYGGSSADELAGLAFSPDGSSLYVAGLSFSKDLPGTAGSGTQHEGILGAPAGFVARFDASLSTLQQAALLSVPNGVTGRAVDVHATTGEVYLGAQCREGLTETAGSFQPLYDGPLLGGFGIACMARFDATLAAHIDADPDAFEFTDQFAVALGSTVTSAPVRIDGITVDTLASVTNGTFSVDGDAFSSGSRSVRRGQSVRVRHVASSSAGGTIDTVLNVGTKSDTFSSIAQTGTDSMPGALAIAPRSPVALGVEIRSTPIVVTGIDTPAAVSISSGEYSIDGGTFTAAAGTIYGGQSVVVRHTSAGTPATTTTTTLTIGGANAAFQSTTDPVDSTPHPIAFKDVVNVLPDFDAISDPVTVIGINVPVPVSVSGGEWSKDGIAFSTSPGTVQNLERIVLRRRAGTQGQTVSATLTVGSQSDDWVLSQPPLGDTTPDPYSFTPVENAPPLTYAYSNEITITGIDVPVLVNPVGGQFLDPVSGLYLSSGMIVNGAKTRIRLLTPVFPGAVSLVHVKIGAGDAVFQVRTAGGDTTPDAFDFIDQDAAAAGAQVLSNTVTLAGLIGDATATVTGCELNINGSSTYVTTPTLVRNNDQLRLRATASASAGSTVTCHVDVGGVGDDFRVTTAASAVTPPPVTPPSAGGGGGGGGGGGALDYAMLIVLLALLGARSSAWRGAHREHRKESLR